MLLNVEQALWLFFSVVGVEQPAITTNWFDLTVQILDFRF